MQTTIFKADKFERFPMAELLDKQGSYQIIKGRLSAFCKDWRDKRGVAHGGITGHHRELVWAMLKVISSGMDWIKDNKKWLWRKLVSQGKIGCFTNRAVLKKKMTEQKEEEEHCTVSIRTVSNLMDRLIEAGIICDKQNYTEEGIPCQTGRGNLLLCMDMELLKFYSPVSEIGEAAPSDSGNSTFLQQYTKLNTEHLEKEINNTEAQDVESGVGFANGLEINKLEVRCKENMHRFSLSTNKTGEKNFAPAASAPPSELDLLWVLACSLLWPGRTFNEETRKACLAMLNNALEAAVGYVQQVRALMIQRFTSSEAYKSKKNEAAKRKALAWLNQFLPDPRRKAQELLSRALQIQAENAQKKNYKIYYPTYYFAAQFTKALSFAQKEYQRFMPYEKMTENAGDALYQRLVAAIWSATSSVAFTITRDGFERGMLAYETQRAKILKMVAQDVAGQLPKDTLELWIQRFDNICKNSLTCENSKNLRSKNTPSAT